MGLQRIAAAELVCVDLATAKTHCKVDVADDDALIQAMVLAATDEAEALTRRAILPQEWRLSLDAFPTCSNVIELRPASVQSVDLVQYVDATTGALQTLAPSEYQASTSSHLVARLAPAYGKSWPSARTQMDAVQVTFTTGWPDVDSVPAAIKQWVLLRVMGYYENRSAWTLGQAIQRNPFTDRLLDRWRVPTI